MPAPALAALLTALKNNYWNISGKYDNIAHVD
jgi:hypothetical protein